MKWLSYIIFYVCCIAPGTHAGEIKQCTTGNFDSDNKPDTIWMTTESGSSVSVSHFSIKCSTWRHPIALEWEYYFSDLFTAYPIPRSITRPMEFAKAMAHLFVPAARMSGDTTAFEWVESVRTNKEPSDSFADFRSRYESECMSSLPEFTPVYKVMSRGRANVIAGADSEKDAIFYVVFYMAHNHHHVRRIQPGDDEFQLTDHGVIHKVQAGYKWVFINDNRLFKTGHEKLRWPSVTGIEIKNGNLLVHTISLPGATHKDFLIDLKTRSILRVRERDN